MKALVKEQRGTGLSLRDSEKPRPGEGEVMIMVKAAGICGTDVHIWNWDKWSESRIKPPLITGHEFAGIVCETGPGVQHISPGQRVSAEGHIACGVCEFCRTGQAHICRDVEIIGIDRNGCFAEYLTVDARNLWPLHDAIDDHLAATFDPAGNAMHTVMAEPVAGKSVLLTGAGAIGLFAVAIAGSLGAEPLIVIEPNERKRQLALEVGADYTLDPAAPNLAETVLDATEGLGPNILLEMSGNQHAITSGLRLLRNGGTASMLGIPSKEITIDWARDVIFKGITIRAINGRRMFDTWFQTQNFLLKHGELARKIITHTMPIDDYLHAFDLLNRGEAVKTILDVA